MTVIDCKGLLSSARDFADRALRAYTEGDERIVLVHAAFSLEHLCKAYLASQHRSLLVELQRNDFDSLLHLVGLADDRAVPRPKTVGPVEAMRRVRRLLPSLQTPEKHLGELFDVRNGLVHAGYLSHEDQDEILAAFLRFSEELHDALGVTPEDRWGPHKELVDALVSESLTRIQQKVTRKILAARRRLREVMETIPEARQGTVGDLRQMMNRQLAYKDRGGMFDILDTMTCPACHHPEALCVGTVEIEYDHGDIDYASPPLLVGRRRLHLHHLGDLPRRATGVRGLRFAARRP